MAPSALDPRTFLFIDDETIELAQSQNLDEMQQRLREAVEHPQFIRVSTADGRELRLLMTAHRRVTIAIVPPWAVTSQQVPEIEGLDILDL